MLPHAQHAGQQKSSYLDADLGDPAAPVFELVQYSLPQPSKTLESKIDGLLYGLNSYIDPEFDFYGHEIRRYMASTVTPSQMNNPAEVLEQYKNIRRARIVADQWKADVAAQVEQLNRDIETAASASRMRSKMTYSQNIIDQFFKNLDAWISTNQAAIEFYFRNKGEYEVVYPLYYFINFADKEDFTQIHIDREKALSEMQKHQPFTKMVY